MTFDYLQRIVVDGQLDVDNIGDCVIQANNDFAEEYYLIVRTILGWVEVLEYGPCLPELQELQHNYTIKYSKFEYNQSRIEKTIDKFLNDAKRSITQARLTTIDEIRENLINPVDRMFPFGGLDDE